MHEVPIAYRLFRAVTSGRVCLLLCLVSSLRGFSPGGVNHTQYKSPRAYNSFSFAVTESDGQCHWAVRLC